MQYEIIWMLQISHIILEARNKNNNAWNDQNEVWMFLTSKIFYIVHLFVLFLFLEFSYDTSTW